MSLRRPCFDCFHSAQGRRRRGHSKDEAILSRSCRHKGVTETDLHDLPLSIPRSLMLHPIVHPAHTRCRSTKIKQTATSEQRDTIGARLNFVTGVSSDHTKGFCWGMQPGTGMYIYIYALRPAELAQ